MARKIAQFAVSGEILRQVMGLPDATLIYAITQRSDRPDEFVFYVEHPDLPEMIEGGTPAVADPMFDSLDGQSKPQLRDWNLRRDRLPALPPPPPTFKIP